MTTMIDASPPAATPQHEEPIRIYRRKRRPTGKATYWVDDEIYGAVQINSDRAKGLVAIGAAVWAGDPIISDQVKE